MHEFLLFRLRFARKNGKMETKQTKRTYGTQEF